MTRRRLYLGPLTDSRRWDMVRIRRDDVIVVTPPKCGTTWMQTIVAMLLSGDPEVEPGIATRMPWIDFRLRDMAGLAARLDAMDHRRCLKSHTPLDGLPVDGRAHYLCVFRHPLDAHLSFRRHARTIPLRVFDMWYPEDDADGVAFRRFLDGGPEGFDGDLGPLAHILRHYEAARALAGRPNVSLFHYADMRRDLAGTVARLSALLGAPQPDALMERIVRAASFESMKGRAERCAPEARKAAFEVDPRFFHAGAVGGWRGAMTEAEVAAYDAAMDAAMAPGDRAWLENGTGA